ncbi:MAG: ATP-grasp domain-containing protein [Candidatus Sulfotelmatobacter sp.]
MKPTVLIATTSTWFPTARLAMALAHAGCVVDAVCPAGHPLGQIKPVRETYHHRGLMALQSFAEAIAATHPDFIIPGDDLATTHLHRLYDRELQKGEAGRPVCQLIERSLGSPESFPIVYERASFMELARDAGIRAPKTAVIASLPELRSWISQAGLPTVLKANGTSGGMGVRVVYTLQEAEEAFQALQSPPLFLRAVKRALIDHDRTLVWPSLLRRRSVVNAQEFVSGREATSAVACWQGTVLASLDFEVLHKRDSAGPSSVLRLIDNAEISATAAAMVARLNLSGLHGFDFMLEAHTGGAHLIEINPRATQVGHLRLGPGHDLPAALYAALAGESVRPVPRVTNNDTIALFPQEWLRDPKSPFLRSAYNDVPWEEPELLRACVRKLRRQGVFTFEQNPLHTLSAVRLPRL